MKKILLALVAVALLALPVHAQTEHFSQSQKIVQAVTVTAGAAGTTEINGTVVDMAGYEGVIMVVQFGPILAGATTTIKAQRDTVLDFDADPQDIEGSSQTVADDDDDKVFYIDIHRPGERFVRLVVGRGVANATASAMYYLYGARVKPPAAHGTGVAGERITDAVEGTP